MRAKAFTGLVVLIVVAITFFLFMIISGVVQWFKYRDKPDLFLVHRSELMSLIAESLLLEVILGVALVFVVLIYKGIF